MNNFCLRKQLLRHFLAPISLLNHSKHHTNFLPNIAMIWQDFLEWQIWKMLYTLIQFPFTYKNFPKSKYLSTVYMDVPKRGRSTINIAGASYSSEEWWSQKELKQPASHASRPTANLPSFNGGGCADGSSSNSTSWAKYSKPTKKFVKLTHHPYACHSLTNFQ